MTALLLLDETCLTILNCLIDTLNSCADAASHAISGITVRMNNILPDVCPLPPPPTQVPAPVILLLLLSSTEGTFVIHQ